MTPRDTTTQVLTQLLEERTGQKLTPNRQWRVETALAALLREHDAATIDELVAQLTSPYGCPLSTRVADALLNNETYFFRDQIVFAGLAKTVLPQLLERRKATRRLSIWSIGCSTGQEPLSLAMLLAEREAQLEGWRIDIVATDVSRRAIEIARRGVYTAFEAQRGLGVQQMIQWFEEADGGWKVSRKLVDMIKYQQHNVLDRPPFGGGFDLVLCRNVLLYFDTPTREKAFAQIAAAMVPEAVLLLGGGETTVGQTRLFTPVKELGGLYKLSDAALAMRPAHWAASA